MPSEHQQAEEMRDDVPSTIARSDDKAVRTYKKTLESAEDSYGDGERAHRAAFSALKHTYEKVGDHWEPKDEPGPSDAQAEQKGSRLAEAAEGDGRGGRRERQQGASARRGQEARHHRGEPDAQGRARRRDPQGQRPGDPEGAFVMTHDQVDTAVFDVDGTLVDTNYHHALSWYRAFRRFDIVLPVWRLHRAIGMGGDNLVAHVAGQDVEERLGEELRSAWEEEFNQLVPEVSAFAGARELLAEVKSRGLRLVLASSGKRRHTEAFLDLLDGKDIADAWTTSDDVEASKPAPDLVSVAMEKVGGTRAVMIGDSVWDAISAREVGVPTIAVRTGGFSTDELRDAGAEWVFDSLEELRADIEKTPLGSGG